MDQRASRRDRNARPKYDALHGVVAPARSRSQHSSASSAASESRTLHKEECAAERSGATRFSSYR
eukprot:6201168-Pleurochrysis_carterae.AAC.2